jgi:hypothetical protein
MQKYDSAQNLIHQFWLVISIWTRKDGRNYHNTGNSLACNETSQYKKKIHRRL